VRPPKASSGRPANVIPFKRLGSGVGEPVGGWRQERRDQAKSWDQTTTRDRRIGGNKLTGWHEWKSRHQGMRRDQPSRIEELRDVRSPPGTV